MKLHIFRSKGGNLSSQSREKIIGAKWWKFDFHTHTPASSDYGRGVNQEQLKKISPGEWLLNFMRAEIDCVAVTDHNSGTWVNALKAELQKMNTEKPVGFRPLVIFPGVEVSTNGGIHVLAIFSPETATENISTFLGAVGFRGTPGETDQCTSKSTAEVIQEVIASGGIAIPAHVDKENGLFTIQGVPGQGPTLLSSLRAGPLAIELRNINSEKPQLYRDQKFKLAEVVGSDSHHPEYVGGVFTWVKMETPSFDALKLALHDGEDGVIRSDSGSIDPNDFGNRFYIREITIFEGAKAGRSTPLKISLSPWLTTLIGGRGSGKSSVLDFLRIALNSTADMPVKIREDFNAFAQVPVGRGREGMLTTGTAIRIEMIKDGREVALTWKGGKCTEEHKNDTGKWISQGDPGDIRERFPIRIFSQKQLYEMTKDSNTLLNIIDSQIDKQVWRDRLQELEKNWLFNRKSFREARASLESYGALQKQLDDISAKMKIFEDSGHREILKRYQDSQRLKSDLDQSLNIGGFAYTIRDIAEDLPKCGISEEVKVGLGQASSDLLAPLLTEWEHICKDIQNISTRVKRFEEKVRESRSTLPWEVERQQAISDYNNLVNTLSAAGEQDPTAYSKLVQKRDEISIKLKGAEQIEKRKQQAELDSEAIFAELISHQKQLREMRNAVIGKWNQQGETQSIRVSLTPMGDIENAETSLRQVLRKSGAEFARDILNNDKDEEVPTGLVFDLSSASDPWKNRDEITKKLVRATEQNPEGLDKRFARYLESLKQSTPEDLDRILIWTPGDRIDLKLIRNGREEGIETGSAGQRTAGMVSLLLALENSPLIIDQPEDDLDTRLISELVVKGLRKLKKNQQSIVVTHNPNIPVNGAAEQIVYMDYKGGQIICQSAGALQKLEIRNAVCEVMEGGKEALQNRYYRISQALLNDKLK